MRKLSVKFLLASGLLVSTASDASPVNVSYDNGTVFEVAETGFKNKINVGIKAGYTYSKLNARVGEDPDNSSFDVGLGRLQLSGEAASGEVGYQIQGDFAQPGLDTDNEFKLANAYVWWKPHDWFKLSVGQMKQGFPAQFMVDDFTAQFYVRDSLATQYYNLGRSQGAMLGIHDPEGSFALKFGIFNGESEFSFADGGYVIQRKEGQNKPGYDTDHRFVVSGRYNILGSVDHKSEGDYSRSEELNWSISAGYSFAKNNIPIIINALDIRLDSNIDFHDVAFGTQLRYAGFSLNAEVFWRDSKLRGFLPDFDPDLAGDDDGFGYYAQSGYFVSPDVEIYGRFAGFDCKAMSLTSAGEICDYSNGDDVFEYSAGASYYIGSEFHRVGFEYSFIDLGNDSERSANDHQRVTVFLSTFF